jgi:hypothetical protein
MRSWIISLSLGTAVLVPGYAQDKSQPLPAPARSPAAISQTPAAPASRTATNSISYPIINHGAAPATLFCSPSACAELCQPRATFTCVQPCEPACSPCLAQTTGGCCATLGAPLPCGSKPTCMCGSTSGGILHGRTNQPARGTIWARHEDFGSRPTGLFDYLRRMFQSRSKPAKEPDACAPSCDPCRAGVNKHEPSAPNPYVIPPEPSPKTPRVMPPAEPIAPPSAPAPRTQRLDTPSMLPPRQTSAAPDATPMPPAPIFQPYGSPF